MSYNEVNLLRESVLKLSCTLENTSRNNINIDRRSKLTKSANYDWRLDNLIFELTSYKLNKYLFIDVIQ